MPIVTIEMWKGRTREQKDELAKAITEKMVDILKIRAESVQIIFNDVEKENWAVGGELGGRYAHNK